jgi:hypothetical protein
MHRGPRTPPTSCPIQRVPPPTMRPRVAQCRQTMWSSSVAGPSTAVGLGGRHSGRCGSGAGPRGRRAHRAAPRRGFLAVEIAHGRRDSISRPGHITGGACGSAARGHGHVRSDRLPAADPLGPATRQPPREGVDHGTELRQVSRDAAAVSLSSVFADLPYGTPPSIPATRDSYPRVAEDCPGRAGRRQQRRRVATTADPKAEPGHVITVSWVDVQSTPPPRRL